MEEIIWGSLDLMDVRVFRVCLRVPASDMRGAPTGYHKKLTCHISHHKFQFSNDL